MSKNNKNTNDKKLTYTFSASLEESGYDVEWDITLKKYEAMSYDEKEEVKEKILNKISDDVEKDGEFSYEMRIPHFNGETTGCGEAQCGSTE